MGTFNLFVLAQSTQPTFFRRLLDNDTVRETSLTGWLTLFGGIFGGVVIGKIAATMLRTAAQRLADRGWQMRSIIVKSTAGPLNLALIGLGISVGMGALAHSQQLDAVASNGLGLLYIIAVAWLLYNLVGLIEAALKNMTSRTESKLDDQLVPLLTKTVRVFLITLMALFIADNIFDADIGAWLAGLGIAGLAVSLAAQDSIKNVFGSVTILIDQPFAVGDFVKVADISGTVEEIGFRSTRLRTANGTLVTIPNIRVAESSIENFARRPSIRRDLDIGITYDTTLPKVDEAIAIVKEILSDPEIAASFDEKTPPRVFLDRFNPDSINIRASYWFRPVDYWLWMEHCEKVNVLVLRRFTEAGIDFAFPTQTMYLVSDPKRPLTMTQQVEAKQT